MSLNCSSHSTTGIPISFLVPTWSFPSTELVSYWLCLQVPWGHFPILFCSGVRPFLSSLEEPLLPYFLSLFCAWNLTREMEQDTKKVQSSTWICGKRNSRNFQLSIMFALHRSSLWLAENYVTRLPNQTQKWLWFGSLGFSHAQLTWFAMFGQNNKTNVQSSHRIPQRAQRKEWNRLFYRQKAKAIFNSRRTNGTVANVKQHIVTAQVMTS